MCSTLQWLGRTTLALLLVVGLPQFAHAAFIDLVSQSYLIHAYGFGYDLKVRDPVVEYTEVSNTPIHRSDRVFFSHRDVGGDVGFFLLSTSADGGVTPSSAFVRAQSDQFDASFGYAYDAAATATITFRPLVSNLIVQAGVPYGLPPFQYLGSLGLAGLYDLSAGVAVLALGSPIEAATYNVSLDLGHLYTMYASVSGPSRDGMLSIVPGPTAVPESGSTLTFFVVGLGALLLVARSQQFRPSTK